MAWRRVADREPLGYAGSHTVASGVQGRRLRNQVWQIRALATVTLGRMDSVRNPARLFGLATIYCGAAKSNLNLRPGLPWPVFRR
jgi:hypothetical protein